jgi:hypothetical protein
LQTGGFISVAKRATYQLWKKTSHDIVHDSIVSIDDQTYPWLDQIKSLLTQSTSQRIWLVSRRFENGILGFFNCLRREPGGHALRYEPLPSSDGKNVRLSPTRCIQVQDSSDVLTESTMNALKSKDLLTNIYRNGVWGSYVHRQLKLSNGKRRLRLARDSHGCFLDDRISMDRNRQCSRQCIEPG